MSDTDTQTPPEAKPGPKPAAKPGAAARRHRTTRHVVTHGGTTIGASATAFAVHAAGAGPVGIAAGAGALLIAGGAYGMKRAKGRKTAASMKPSLVRKRSAKASAQRPAAGLRRGPVAKPGAKAGATATKPGAAKTRGPVAASRRKTTGPGATPRRSAGLRRGQDAGRTATKGGRRVATTKRPTARPGKPATGPRVAAKPGAAIARPGAPRHAAKRPTTKAPKAPAPRKTSGTKPPSTPKLRTAPGPKTQAARTTAKRTASRRAAANRRTVVPRPKMRTATRPPSNHVRRHAARIAMKRRSRRATRFLVAGAVAARPFFRPWPSKAERAADEQKKALAAKPAMKSTETAEAPKKTAKATTQAKPKTRPVVSRPATKPGHAITAPGVEKEKVSEANIPTGGITAVMEAIDEHIGGFEPDNILEIFGFLSGLAGVCTHFATALSTVADRLGSDFPIEGTVVDHLHEMASFAANLGGWGESAHHVARAAHETELRRIEDPRPREEVWDVQNNR